MRWNLTALLGLLALCAVLAGRREDPMLELNRRSLEGWRWQALHSADRYLRNTPNDPDLLVQRATACLQLGFYAQAAQGYRRLRHQDPQPQFTYLEAVSLERDGQVEEARRLYTSLADQPDRH